MKKLILALTILAFAGARVQTASAGVREWRSAWRVFVCVGTNFGVYDVHGEN